jgi:DNA-binding transcriptional MerR regulator
MPKEINSQLFYSATETCERTGISRATLHRWLQKGVLNKIRRDRRGWRLFTDDDLSVIIAEIERVNVEEIPRPSEKVRQCKSLGKMGHF